MSIAKTELHCIHYGSKQLSDNIDDYAYLADNELGEAPIPGEYDKPLELRSFKERRYNIKSRGPVT